MLLLLFFSLANSIIIKLNDKQINKNDFATALSASGIAKVDLKTIEVVEQTGNFVFPINDIEFGDFPMLEKIIVPAKFYTSNISENKFKGFKTLKYIEIKGASEILSCAFQYCTQLETAIFDSVISIGESAFGHCYSLKNISFPVATTLYQYCFESCSLEEAIFPEVTEIKTFCLRDQCQQNELKSHAFENCYFLKHVSFPKANPDNANGMFQGCNVLESIDFPLVNNTEILMFNDIRNLRRVSLGVSEMPMSNLNSKATLSEIRAERCIVLNENALKDYIALEKVVLPNVAYIHESAFQGCLKLLSLDLPNLTHLYGDNIFNGCTRLIKISMPSLVSVNSSCQNIFANCPRVQIFVLPAIPPETFHKNTFINMKLQAPDLFRFKANNLRVYDDDVNIEGDVAGDNKWCQMALYETNESEAIIDADTLQNVTTEFANIVSIIISHGTIERENCSNFAELFPSAERIVVFKEARFENDTIPTDFVSNHQHVESIIIQANIDIIEESAFSQCRKLHTLIIENVSTLLSYAFFDLPLITNLSLPTVQCLIGEKIFCMCPKLHTLVLTGLINSSSTLPITSDCPALKNIYLPETPPKIEGFFSFDGTPKAILPNNPSARTYDKADSIIDQKFYGLSLEYSLITAIVDGTLTGIFSIKSGVPQDVETLEITEGELVESDLIFTSFFDLQSLIIGKQVDITIIPPNAFSNLKNLEEVIIYSQVPFTISGNAFDGCSSLTAIFVEKATCVKESAFKDCASLKTITLNNVQSLDGDYIFSGCNSLTTVSLKSLVNVSDVPNIFQNCRSLAYIELGEEPPQTFHKDTFIYSTPVLILPEREFYDIYDSDTSVEDDVENDGKWCSLLTKEAQFEATINKNIMITTKSFDEMANGTEIDSDSIISIEITKGYVNLTNVDFSDLFPILKTFTINRNVMIDGTFDNEAFIGSMIEEVSIPKVTTISDSVFKDCEYLKFVTLDDVTTIGSHCFQGCTHLEKISLPRLLSIKGIECFAQCSALKYVEFTSLVEVYSRDPNLFNGCKLEKIKLPNNPPETFNKDTFKDMEVILDVPSREVFKQYDNSILVEGDAANDYKWCGIELMQIYINASINQNKFFVAESIETIAQQYNIIDDEVVIIDFASGIVENQLLLELATKYENIVKLNIGPGVKISSNIITKSMFSAFRSLQYLTVHKDVIIGAHAFENCNKLVEVQFDSVESVHESAFSDCVSLENPCLSSCKHLYGDSIFKGCSSLKQLNLSALVSVPKDSENIFSGCTQLVTLILPSTPPSTFNKNTFNDCPNVKLMLPYKSSYFTYDDDTMIEGDKEDDLMWCKVSLKENISVSLITYTINNKQYKRKTLKSGMNDQTQSITAIELTGGVIDAVDLYNSLRNASAASTIKTFTANEGTISYIYSNTFMNCKSLQTLIINGKVQLDHNALNQITNLEKLEMKDLTRIDSSQFIQTDNLQDISLPALVEVDASLFQGMKNLRTLNLSNARIINEFAFSGCNKLNKLEMKKVQMINGDEIFKGCQELTKLSFKNLVSVSSDAENMFEDCSNLASIEFGNFPPQSFNEEVFAAENMKQPDIVIPEECIENYIQQSVLESDTYYWKGIPIHTKGSHQSSFFTKTTKQSHEQSFSKDEDHESSLATKESNKTSFTTKESNAYTSEKDGDQNNRDLNESGMSSLTIAMITLAVIFGASTIALIVIFIVIFRKRCCSHDEVDLEASDEPSLTDIKSKYSCDV